MFYVNVVYLVFKFITFLLKLSRISDEMHIYLLKCNNQIYCNYRDKDEMHIYLLKYISRILM